MCQCLVCVSLDFILSNEGRLVWRLPQDGPESIVVSTVGPQSAKHRTMQLLGSNASSKSSAVASFASECHTHGECTKQVLIGTCTVREIDYWQVPCAHMWANLANGKSALLHLILLIPSLYLECLVRQTFTRPSYWTLLLPFRLNTRKSKTKLLCLSLCQHNKPFI